MKSKRNGSGAAMVFIAVIILLAAAALVWTHYYYSPHPTPSPATAVTGSSTSTIFLALNGVGGVDIGFPRSWHVGPISNSTGSEYGYGLGISTTSVVVSGQGQERHGLFTIGEATSIQDFGSGATLGGTIDHGFLYYPISSNTDCDWGLVLNKGDNNNDHYFFVDLNFQTDVYGTSTTMREPYQAYCDEFDAVLRHAALY